MVVPLVTAPEPRRHATFHTLRVAAVEELTPDAVALTFEVPPALAADYRFEHGQHVSVRCVAAGDEARRNYSICAAAGSGVLRVAVKRLDGGVFSAYAHSRLRPGDTLEVMTPTGRFHTPLDPTTARSYVAIAAGSGITPIISIIATTLAVEPRSSVTLLYGNRTMQDIMFLEELEDLKNRYCERFSLYHCLSQEQQEVGLFNGRIDRDRLLRFLDTLLSDDVDEWFVCGPPAMITAARAVLGERGVEPRHIHSELFHAEGRQISAPAVPRVAAAGSQVTVILDGRASSFALDPAGEPILDAALRLRSDAPYACKDGVCGTCRAKLLEGAVTMEQCYALEDAEVEAGYVLACQSHPSTPTVRLDFDQ